jgi:hypothetical protein
MLKGFFNGQLFFRGTGFRPARAVGSTQGKAVDFLAVDDPTGLRPETELLEDPDLDFLISGGWGHAIEASTWQTRQ